jgi:hypothetical protein
MGVGQGHLTTGLVLWSVEREMKLFTLFEKGCRPARRLIHPPAAEVELKKPLRYRVSHELKPPAQRLHVMSEAGEAEHEILPTGKERPMCFFTIHIYTSI